MTRKKIEGKKIERIKKLLAKRKISKALDVATVSDIEALFQIGFSFYENGKHDEEIKCYDKALQIDPNHADAWYNKGVTLGDLGKQDEAIKCFDKATGINPEDSDAWHNKGVALSYLGKQDEAIKCFDKAIEKNPNHDKSWLAKGVALGDLGKHREEIECYDKAIKINPKLVEAWYNKGVALGNLGKHDEEIKCYDKALQIDPNHADAWHNKGATLGTLGKHKEAGKCFNKAIEIDPNHAEARIGKGASLGNLGKHDEAIKCYDKAIQMNPNLADAWVGKGVALGNLGKHDEEIKCYNKALQIDPNHAEAWHNKGIALLNMRQYDEAKVQFKRAKDFFSKVGMKNAADEAYKYGLWAENASELFSRMIPLDRQFLECLNSQSLTGLREKASESSIGVAEIVKEFEKRDLPTDVYELLVMKKICFAALSNAIQFHKVDLKRLEEAKEVFEKWGFDTFVIAANSIDTFVRLLSRYHHLEEIPKEREEFILRLLFSSYVLDGKLTEAISGRIKGEPYTVKPTGMGIEREPRILYKYIADTEKEWVRFCLVQLDFSVEPHVPPKEFGYTLIEKDKIKDKVLKALEIARENKVDVICFPELSFDKQWIEEIKNRYREMIIIGGTYYDEGYNVCPIIMDGREIDPPYRKHLPSPNEKPETTGRGMRSGSILYIFQTKCGRFSVLTCIDYTDQSYPICRHKGKGVDYIINPCHDSNISRFQPRCNSDCEDYEIDVIQVNRAPDDSRYGGSCIIGREHDSFLVKLRVDGFKPADDVKYKLFQLDGETMAVVDLNIWMKPPVSLPINYTGRVRISKKQFYRYEKGLWSHLSN